MADIKITAKDVKPLYKDLDKYPIGIAVDEKTIKVSGVYVVPDDAIPNSPYYMRPKRTLWQRFKRWIKSR